MLIESLTSEAGALVFGCTCWWHCSTTSEKTLRVLLCRFEIEMRAARSEKSGCWVDMYAANIVHYYLKIFEIKKGYI
jgi:hypothetical protein